LFLFFIIHAYHHQMHGDFLEPKMIQNETGGRWRGVVIFFTKGVHF